MGILLGLNLCLASLLIYTVFMNTSPYDKTPKIIFPRYKVDKEREGERREREREARGEIEEGEEREAYCVPFVSCFLLFYLLF